MGSSLCKTGRGKARAEQDARTEETGVDEGQGAVRLTQVGAICQNSRPPYLGKLGAYDKGGMASRVRWTSVVARSAERFGWSWGYWQFDGDFILYDMKSQKWVEPIREALIPAVK